MADETETNEVVEAEQKAPKKTKAKAEVSEVAEGSVLLTSGNVYTPA